MNNGGINEQLITQGNHSPQDAIGLGKKVLKVTIRALPTSLNNVYVGWNAPASPINILEPGDSATYDDLRIYLDKESLYIDFDPSGFGGQALVTVIFDRDEANC